MIAAGYQSISSCQSQRLPALQAGQAHHQVGLMFRRDSTGHVSVESFSRRVNIEHSLFGQFGLGFHRVKSQKGSRHLKAKRCPLRDPIVDGSQLLTGPGNSITIMVAA